MTSHAAIVRDVLAEAGLVNADESVTNRYAHIANAVRLAGADADDVADLLDRWGYGSARGDVLPGVAAEIVTRLRGER